MLRVRYRELATLRRHRSNSRIHVALQVAQIAVLAPARPVVFAVFPGRRLMRAKTHGFIDMLQVALQQ